MSLTRRLLLAASLATGLASLATAASAQVKEIRIDYATYNPVSLVLKDKGFLEKELDKDGIKVRWVQSLGSNKALEFLNAGSIDFGSTAGAAALIGKINGNPIKSIYVYSRPEWTALVTRKDTGITKVEDLKGKRVAVTRGTDPHIFLVRALQEAKLTEKDVKLVLLQHPDGRTALERGDVDAWAGLDPLMAAAEVESGAQLFYRNAGANTWGVLNVSRSLRQGQPGSRRARAQGLRGSPQVLARQQGRAEEDARHLHQAVRGGDRAPARAHGADAFLHRPAADRHDPRRGPRPAAGRRHHCRDQRARRRRFPHRPPLRHRIALMSSSRESAVTGQRCKPTPGPPMRVPPLSRPLT